MNRLEKIIYIKDDWLCLNSRTGTNADFMIQGFTCKSFKWRSVLELHLCIIYHVYATGEGSSKWYMIKDTPLCVLVIWNPWLRRWKYLCMKLDVIYEVVHILSNLFICNATNSRASNDRNIHFLRLQIVIMLNLVPTLVKRQTWNCFFLKLVSEGFGNFEFTDFGRFASFTVFDAMLHLVDADAVILQLQQ